MTHTEAKTLLEEIHKIKFFRPDAREKKFLEDLSFNLVIDNIKVSEKQSKTLQKIYRKAQEFNV